MATPEGIVKALVTAWSKKTGVFLVSIIPSAFGSSTGVSDKIGILNDGTFLAIEIKAAGKRKNVTSNQQKFLDAINNRGGIAVVIDGKEALDQLDILIKDHMVTK